VAIINVGALKVRSGNYFYVSQQKKFEKYGVTSVTVRGA